MRNVRRGSVGPWGIAGAVVSLALIGGVLAGPAQAEPSPAAGSAAVIDCPPPVPIGEVAADEDGTGWTVVRGTTPQPFNVKVLGVLADGIGAGRDLIMVEVSDLPGGHVVDQGGGIWAGMSGSPVYLNGRLLGAVSYGFTAAPSPIGGITPAADMMNVLTMTGAAAAKAQRPDPAKIKLSTAQRRTIAARADAAVPSGGLERLRVPMSVSGLTGARLSRLQHEFDAAGRPALVYAGGRATAGTRAAAATVHAGGNFGAVLTYGDLTIGGVGTTTAVCGNQALAFGHPMAFGGRVAYGATGATSLAIVKDATLGSFKMANLTGTVGVVDQDRLAAIRARLGAGPVTVPVTSTITNADSGARRTGTTAVADPSYAAVATAYGVLANYDSTFDKVGRGQATSSWTITGTRAGGVPFTITRSNRWSSLGDISVQPLDEVAGTVDALSAVDTEPVTIKTVTFTSTVESAYQQYRIVKLAVSVNGGKYKSPATLRVKVGDKIKVRTTIRKYRSSKNYYSQAALTVTKKMAGRTGTLQAEGGLDAANPVKPDAPGCLLGTCGGDDQTLNSVIKDINTTPRNDDVVTSLSIDPPDGSNANPITTTVSKRRGATVTGSRSLDIEVRR